MSTCRGCWNDWRVPMGPGLVTMCVDASPDPWVAHGNEKECPTFVGGQPHRMSECQMFDHSVSSFET